MNTSLIAFFLIDYQCLVTFPLMSREVHRSADHLGLTVTLTLSIVSYPINKTLLGLLVISSTIKYTYKYENMAHAQVVQKCKFTSSLYHCQWEENKMYFLYLVTCCNQFLADFLSLPIYKGEKDEYRFQQQNRFFKQRKIHWRNIGSHLDGDKDISYWWNFSAEQLHSRKGLQKRIANLC